MSATRTSSLTRRIVVGTFHYGLGQALPQVVRFLLIPVYTYFLTPDDYGVLELAGAFAAFLLIAMRLGVPGAVTRFYFDHEEGSGLSDYVTTIAIFLLGSSFVVAVLMVLAGPWLFSWLLPGVDFYPVGPLVIGSTLFGCNQNLQDRLVQAREQSSYAAKLNIGRATVSICLALLMVVGLRWGVFGMLLAELIAGVIFFIQAGRYLWPDLQGRFRPELLRSSFAYAAGILPSHFLGNVAPLVTRSYLANVVSLAAVGQLGIATRFTLPLSTLASAFQTAFNPIYYSLRNDRTSQSLETIAKMARNVCAIAVTCVLAGMLLFPPLIRLMTPVQFHVAANLVPILCIGFLGQALYTIVGPELFYSKKTYWVPVVSGVAVLVTVALTLLTARDYGATGLAWGTAAGSLTSALTAGAISRRLVSVPLRYLDLLRIGSCGFAVAMLGIYMPIETTSLQLPAMAACLVVFPMLLWVTGDPTIREVMHFASDQLKKHPR